MRSVPELEEATAARQNHLHTHNQVVSKQQGDAAAHSATVEVHMGAETVALMIVTGAVMFTAAGAAAGCCLHTCQN